MKQELTTVIIFLILCNFTLAYIDTLEDCLKVASQFSNTCKNLAVPQTWTTSFPTETFSCQNTGLCPDGTNTTTCTWKRKLCITCSMDQGRPMMRIQTNGLPNHCYNTSGQIKEVKIDYKVQFNRIVNNNIISQLSNQNDMNRLVCDNLGMKAINIQSDYRFQDMGSNVIYDQVVGVAVSGVLIYSGVEEDQTDALYPKQWNGRQTTVYVNPNVTSQYDRCLGSVDQETGIYHYRTMSPCLFDNTHPAGQCQKDQECQNQIKDYMLNTYKSNKTLRAIGMAKDGRVIYGPYNQYGELWNCNDVDFCNGKMLEDGSYAYLATRKFPYTVGCWGPSASYEFYPECSDNTCQNALYMKISLSLFLLVIVSFLL